MGYVTGIPNTRISDLFVRQRLLSQVQSDQIDLFRVQTQLSTGRRIQLPSEDANAAGRIMSLQRLLERKDQIRTNLTTNQSYLTASDSALSSISENLAQVRATALGVLGTVATDTQRQAASHQVQQTIQQLLDTANQNFRGRYLFAGARTQVLPFETVGANIRYSGDESRLASYADVDLLFETNLPGNEVFGGISEKVLGIELDPLLTYDTRLADLRGGQGITHGSIAVSDGSSTRTIDISGAETIGDVAAEIRAQPPAGKTLDVQVTATGLRIELLGGGMLTIREVGGGTTAEELGILQTVGVSPTVVGDPLDPVLRETTRLDDILGKHSAVIVSSEGNNNDLIFQAKAVGTALEGTQIVIQDSGFEGVTYVPGTLTFDIDLGKTTAQDIIDMVAGDAAVAALFTVTLDRTEPGGNSGAGTVKPTDAADPQLLSGGAGTPLDLQNGLRIVNGGQTHVIDATKLDSAETIEDILNVLNMSGAGVLAEINDTATGINVRSRLSGCDFMIGENGGTTAAQLGLRTFTGDTRLEDLNYGLGVEDRAGTDFTITLSDATTIDVDIAGATTIDEVMALINTLAPGQLEARPAEYGNGIDLVETSVLGGTLTISKSFLSNAAIDLGLIDRGQQSKQVSGGPGELPLNGNDVNLTETESIFTPLLRLQEALESNDIVGARHAIEVLDERVLRLNFARAELGARQQGLDVMQQRLDSEEIDLQSALSEDFDVDMVEAISNFTGRQIAFEAALRTTANIFQMTLLNYL